MPGFRGVSAPGRGVPGGDPPHETATAAGDTHPTGMHSCYKVKLPNGETYFYIVRRIFHNFVKMYTFFN